MAHILLPNKWLSSLSGSLRRYHYNNALPKASTKLSQVSVTAEQETLKCAYVLDKCPDKVNLAMDTFHDKELKSAVPRFVKKAEIYIACDDYQNHEYLPVLGNPEFRNLSLELVLGNHKSRTARNKTISIQTLSSTGAMRLAADFLKAHMKCNTCLIAEPAIPHYSAVFKAAGFKDILAYKYYDSINSKLHLHGLIADFLAAPERSLIVFQMCGQNPTGVDPATDEWQLISHLIKCKRFYTLFIAENQGLASGNIEQDSWPVRHFIESGVNVFCAQSFSNSFSLHNERIGNLIVSLNDTAFALLDSKFDEIVRGSYGSPPAFGSRIISKILTHKDLRNEWLEHLKINHLRIKAMRTSLVQRLQELQVAGNWQHLQHQSGIFSITGLTETQIERLIQDKHIYLLKSGRINISGLNEKNIDYVAKSIKEVTNDTKAKDLGIERSFLKPRSCLAF